MSCFICGSKVEPTVLSDSEEYACPECGNYRISKAAIEMYKRHHWVFDVYLARRWIADQKGSGEIPLMDSTIAVRLVDV